MKKALITLLMLFWAASQVNAMNPNCGQGLPCGPVPWPIPAYPVLLTPTPIPTVQATFLANPVPSGTPTPTPVPTLFFDNGPFENSISTYQAVTNGTPYIVTNPEGTPITSDSVIAEMSLNTGTLFAYLKGLVGLNTGWTGVMLTFIVVLFGGFLAIKVFTFMVPIFLAILGLFKRLFDMVMEFLPL